MTVLLQVPIITAIQLAGLETIRLPFDSEATMTDPYIVKQIDGLDPPEQQVAIAKTASGGKFQGKQSADREIVVLIALNSGDPKVLRNNLYTMLSTGHDPKVNISLYSGVAGMSSVDAYVTRFEAALFVKEPVVQITFSCLNPVFKAPLPTRYHANSLSETHPSVYNSGTADTGFQFSVKFTDDMEHWFLRFAADQTIGMTFDKDFNAGDTLTVSTVPGQRFVHWNKAGGTVQNKLNILRNNSEWISLKPGHNHFVVPAGTTKWQWKGYLTFTAQYWGV